MPENGEGSRPLLDDPSTDLASNRTAMSFERTAMSSDRTLMSVIRTSLSLIGFGFTIYSFFHSLIDQLDLPSSAGYIRFALILIAMGMLLLALGIGSHVVETRARRRRRQALCDRGLIRHVEPVRMSHAMVIAILLFVAGLLALVRVIFTLGPL